jgi:hypothetical protein
MMALPQERSTCNIFACLVVFQTVLTSWCCINSLHVAGVQLIWRVQAMFPNFGMSSRTGALLFLPQVTCLAVTSNPAVCQLFCGHSTLFAVCIGVLGML